ncbi:hypothetical protein IC620_13770 [Hazenella sp. IB182357]|uniref:Uncharacterized protein n=1 Tax=Polycladospora coralii TaxID=2771432 RepID=A0A926NBC3_9BACL|nr:hypothetical protein [Polycladospora coralii]MBD1373418.1 hypothetical protein [Polycladospora coralii]
MTEKVEFTDVYPVVTLYLPNHEQVSIPFLACMVVEIEEGRHIIAGKVYDIFA